MGGLSYLSLDKERVFLSPNAADGILMREMSQIKLVELFFQREHETLDCAASSGKPRATFLRLVV